MTDADSGVASFGQGCGVEAQYSVVNDKVWVLPGCIGWLASERNSAHVTGEEKAKRHGMYQGITTFIPEAHSKCNSCP